MFKGFIKLIKLLNANENPAQLAGALVLSMVLALTPFWDFHNLIVILLVCMLRINLFVLFLSFPVWSGIAWIIDPYSASLGEALLLSESMNGLWTSLYQNDLFRLAHFNNTLTLGSILLSAILALPVYFVSVLLIKRYRDTFIARVERMRIVQALKATTWYQRLASAYDLVEVVR